MRTKTALVLGSVAGSLGSLTAAAAELLRYSPWGDPQALTDGIRLAGAGLLLLVFPVAVLVIWFARQLRAQARALGLSPGQAALAEFAVMEVVHHEWARHNREVSARLTDSVMGPERTER
jgi:hypothetical protein